MFKKTRSLTLPVSIISLPPNFLRGCLLFLRTSPGENRQKQAALAAYSSGSVGNIGSLPRSASVAGLQPNFQSPQPLLYLVAKGLMFVNSSVLSNTKMVHR